MDPGDVIPYLQMCAAEGASLQRGMNYRLHHDTSVLLMSRRPGAPYADSVEEDGRVLIYEGHDVPTTEGTPNPKLLDQVATGANNTLTQNGYFYEAAHKYKRGEAQPEKVRVYEKIKSGIWVFNGTFLLLDAWQEKSNERYVYKFKLELTESSQPHEQQRKPKRILVHNRLIPTSVKVEVWRRDKGRCVECGSNTNLHFDHIIPYAKGGSSLVPANVQLLCAKHNLEKGARII